MRFFTWILFFSSLLLLTSCATKHKTPAAETPGSSNANNNQNSGNTNPTEKEYRISPSVADLTRTGLTVNSCSTVFSTFFSNLAGVGNDLSQIRTLCESSANTSDPDQLAAIQTEIDNKKSDINFLLSNTEAGQYPYVGPLFTGVDFLYYIDSTAYICVDGKVTDLTLLNTRINLDSFSTDTGQNRTQCMNEVDNIFLDNGDNSFTKVMNYKFPQIPVDMGGLSAFITTKQISDQTYSAVGQTGSYMGHDISDFFCEEIRNTVQWAVYSILGTTSSMLQNAQAATDPGITQEDRNNFNAGFQLQYRTMDVVINEFSTINHHTVVAGESHYKDSCLRGLVFDVTAEGLGIAGYDLTSIENAQAAVDAFSGLDSKLNKMYIVASSLPFIDYSRPGRFDTVPLSKLNMVVDAGYSLFPDFIAPSVQVDPVARIFDHIIMIPKTASTIALTTATFEDGATVTVKKNNINVVPWASNSFHMTNVSNGDVIHVKVTSTDNSTISTYNLTVLKGDARLNALSVDGQTLTPVFGPMTTKYCLELDSSQDITINAKTIDPDVSVLTGAGLSSPAVVSTSNGVDIPITVTDGALIRTSTITPYIRGQEVPAGCKDILSANGFAYYLSNIVVQGNGLLTLSPAFYYGTSEYSVTVPADVNNISLTLSTFTTDDVIITSSRNDGPSSECNSKVLNIQDVINGDRICVYALSADRSQGGSPYCIDINK